MTSKLINNKFVQIIACGILGAAVSFFVTTHVKNKEIKQNETVIAELTGELQVTRNKAGQTLVQKQAAEAEIKVLKQAYSKDITNIKKEFGIKEKNLKAMIKASTESHYLGHSDRVDTVFVKQADSTTVPTLEGQDSTKWINIKVALSPHMFNYAVDTYDSLTFAFGYERIKVEGKMFKRPRLMVNAKNQNPHSRITGLTTFYVVDEKPIWVVIGPSIGYGIGLDKQGDVKTVWFVGATATVPLIKLRQPWK